MKRSCALRSGHLLLVRRYASKINTYLPDEIGEEAKARGLNLSRLLRDAVTAELRWQRAESDDRVETYEVPVLLEDDRDVRRQQVADTFEERAPVRIQLEGI